MIRRAFLVVLPALVAGCGNWPFGAGGAAGQASGPPDPVFAACEAGVNDDPEVKLQQAFSAAVGSKQPTAQLDALNAAKRNSVQRCLARHGRYGVGNGVERPN
jgi:hypothetical protein